MRTISLIKNSQIRQEEELVENEFTDSWVLDGATVLYGSATEMRATLDYDFSEEKKFSY